MSGEREFNRLFRIGRAGLFALLGAACVSAAHVVAVDARRNACALTLLRTAADECVETSGLRAYPLGRPDKLAEAIAILAAAKDRGLARPTDAVARLDPVAGSDPHDPLVWSALGKAFEDAGRPDRAEDAYRHALSLDGMASTAPARFYLSTLMSVRNDWPEVIALLTTLPRPSRAVTERPCGLCGLVDWSGAWMLRAKAMEQTGRIDEAAGTYRQFLDDRPGFRRWQDNRAFVALGALEARQGEAEAAVRHLARAIDLTLGFPPAFESAYPDDTWRRIRDVAEADARAHGTSPLDAAARAVADTAHDAGAWLMVVATSLSACDAGTARLAAGHAEAIDGGAARFTASLQVSDACPRYARAGRDERHAS